MIMAIKCIVVNKVIRRSQKGGTRN
jgi:hypothetical protein